jgi:flavin-dependent dehydrogenase
MSVFSVERNDSKDLLQVLIAGGGVAGLEAALALEDLAKDRVSTTLLAPAREFVYRPMTVRESSWFPTPSSGWTQLHRSSTPNRADSSDTTRLSWHWARSSTPASSTR